MKLGVVTIGRNEGERLKRCLRSASAAGTIVYVDSGSDDGSPQWAREQGTHVVELDMSIPFTAARARNAGFRRLREIAPDIAYVQFVDGDCEILDGWLQSAVSFLDARADIGAVCGRLRERHPERSIYNWLCEQEWDAPTGEVSACAGNVIMRADALSASGGYRDDVIAGEEGELCIRMRRLGWRIWRLGVDMALHDAGMLHFGQWWSRALRSGYGFAQGAFIHGASKDRYYLWETRRAWLWGVILPLACLVIGLAFQPWGWLAWLIFPLQFLRQALRNQGSAARRLKLALFQVLSRFPESWGQMKFARDRLAGRRPKIIEYK